MSSLFARGSRVKSLCVSFAKRSALGWWVATLFAATVAPTTSAAPVITVPPTNATATAGQNTSLSVTATGTGTLSYQWYKGSTAISGATNSTLALSNVQTTDRGSYKVAVTDTTGTVTSSFVLLEVPQFVVGGAGGALLTSADGSTWTSRSSTTTKRLRGVAASGPTIVVVGETGTILTSSDGSTWSNQTSGTTDSLRGVAANSTRFVAVGGKTTARVLTSTDGISWASSTPPGGVLRAVAWGNGLFVAVGTNGTLLTSPDGTTWTSQTSGTTTRLDGVVWTGSQFEVVSATGAVLASTDGITWTSSQASPPDWIEGFAWSSTRLVALGASGQIRTSTDGIAWSIAASGTSATLHGITWTGGATPISGNPVTLLGNIDFRLTTSPLSQTITAGLAGVFNAVASIPSATYQWFKNGSPINGATSSSLTLPSVQAGDAASYTVSISNGVTNVSSSAAILSLRGQGTTGQQFIAVGQSGTILTSIDGLSWTARNSGTTRRLRATAASADIAVAVGEIGTVLTSPNGSAWAIATSGTTQTLRGIAFGTSQFVVVGGNSAGLILYSTNGTTWSAPTIPTVASLRAVAYGNGIFIAVGQSGSTLKSTDGLTWTAVTTGSTERLDGVVWTGSRFEILSATGVVLASADGITWTSSQATPPNWIEGFAWSTTRLVALGTQGVISTSTDGLLWSFATSNTSVTLHGLTWTGSSSPISGDPVALLGNIDFHLLIPPLSQTISAGLSVVFKALASSPSATYQWFKDLIPIAGANSTTLTLSNVQLADAGSYSVSISNGPKTVLSYPAALTLLGQGTSGQQFVAVGQTGTILTSPDGVTWTRRTSGTTRRLRAASANADTIVAVGEVGTILTSADGVTWSQSTSGTTQTLRGTAFGINRFVAVGGNANGLVLSSYNGTNWVAVATPTVGSLRAVTWGNGLFIAVGQNGSVLKSVDAATWTAVTIGSTERLDGVVWTGTQFIVVTQTGTLLTSSDATTWSTTNSTPPSWVEGLAWNSSRYVVVGASGQIETTQNGQVWTGALPDTTATLHGVTWTGSANTAGLDIATSLTSLSQLPIVTGPLPALVGPGGVATFTVSAAGAQTYQWKFNGTLISNGSKYAGATTGTLAILNVSASDVGSYTVVVTNSSGSVTSTAQLTLGGQPPIWEQFVAVGDNGTILASGDGSTWVERNSGTTRRLRAVTAGTGWYVAVGEGGTILVGTGGVSWTAQISGTTQTLRGVAAAPSRYVAVGGDSAPLILSSANATTWAPVQVSAAGTLRAVAYGPSGFVAVGKNGAVVTSRDGIAWTSVNAGTSERLDGVAWTGTQYVAVSQTGALLSSTNLTTWTSSTSNLPAWAEGVAWNLKGYVVVGVSGRVATSTDGSSWTSVPSGTTATLHGVLWTGGMFTAPNSPGSLFSNLQQTPVVTTSPTSAIVSAGSSQTLSVVASGSGLTYQWLKNGVPISGATTNSFVLTNAQGRDSGQYSAKVSNANGSVVTDAVFVTVPPTYTFTTLVGSSSLPGTADGDSSIARFATPTSVAIDANGNLYVSDQDSHTVRKVTPAGTVTTIAGLAGISGSSDGLAGNARFNGPGGVVVDTASNVFVCDYGNRTIRKIAPDGTVTTFAGLAGAAGPIDGTGTGARFTNPMGIAATSSGRLVVADFGDATIREIATDAVVTTLAGRASVHGSVDGTESLATFNYPFDVAVDDRNNVYIADFIGQIRRIAPSGIVSTVDAGPMLSSNLRGITIDHAGNLYATDSLNSTIMLVNQGGAKVAIGGMNGQPGYAEGIGSTARFSMPAGIKISDSGILYIADRSNRRIRVGTPSFVMPGFTSQPTHQAVAIGVPVNLSVQVSGTGPFTYQWLKNRTPIANATNSSFAITSAQLDDAGTYQVVATGAGGAVTSTPAIITVNALLPSFSTNPSSATVTAGQTTTFSAVAAGNPAPTLQWRFNGTPISGATSTSYQVISATSANAGSYDVVATNAAGSVASSAAVLTVNTPPPPSPPIIIVPAPVNTAPTITSGPSSQNATAGQTVSFSVTASGTPTPSYQWRKNGTAINGATAATLTIGGVTGADVGTYDVVVTNAAGSVTSSTASLSVDQAPAILTQPQGLTVGIHQSASFSVTATGSPAPTYQWRKDGTAINGATQSTFIVADASAANAGGYSVLVMNRAGTATSVTANLIVSAPPTITTQPKPQVALVGSTATFTVVADGAASYQWKKNGSAISGATSSTLTLTNVATADAGSYDVIASNTFGNTSSTPAELTVTTAATAPVITTQPAAQTITVGNSATFNVAATGVPTPTFQWRKNGVAIVGATSTALQLTTTVLADAGTYDVTISNSAGSVTSNGAALTVLRHSYAGVYFGSFGNGGSFALYVRADNTGVLLAYLAGSSTPFFSASVVINDDGQFAITQDVTATPSSSGTEAGYRATLPAQLTISGSIGLDGAVSGSVSGTMSSSLSATRSSDVGPSQASAGYYAATASGTSATSFTIVSATGQAFVLTQSATSTDAGIGTVTASGQITIATAAGQTVSGVVSAATLSATVTDAKGLQTNFMGAAESITATQRLINVSSRVRSSPGDGVAIAGFIISGEQSKPVLIRAVGPSLSAFGVTDVLATPKLELYRGATSIATNTGWTTSGNTEEIAAAALRIGAFALNAASKDSVLYLTLQPGAYTALMSSSNGQAGNGMIEVYDLSSPAIGQKLVNISTRAVAGTGDSSLIAGLVISGSVPKRVLIRGVGPSLTQFGLTGVAPRPQLVVYQGTNVVTRAGTWSTSPDAAAIAAAAQQVGAFGLVSGSQDAALIVSLQPGAYSAVVQTDTPGIALVEVYELP